MDSQFPNPNSAVDFLRLRNGHLLLVYNHSQTERSPLTIAISTDNDKTYPYRRDIRDGDNDYAYPIVIQTQDGKIRVLHTMNKRTTIEMVSFDEEAILQHKRGQ